MDIWEILSIIAQIVAYILAIIVIVQIIKLLFGGSWKIEDVILTLLVVNITLTFGVMGYLMKLNSVIHGHIEWHKGRDS
ncbi:MAG: hypothetical protein AABY22_04005 [Nanoarchaeota archaeon]